MCELGIRNLSPRIANSQERDKITKFPRTPYMFFLSFLSFCVPTLPGAPLSAGLHAPGRRPCPGRPPGEEDTHTFRMVGDASLATGEEED